MQFSNNTNHPNNKTPNKIYTDLASEARELNPDLPGVTEVTDSHDGIFVSRITISNPDSAAKLGKSCGQYVTIDVPDLILHDNSLIKSVSETTESELKNLIGEIPKESTILVVGLGNRLITPDSLGPRVVEKTLVTRHVTEYMKESVSMPMTPVCAISPGVLGVTGIETLDVVTAVCDRLKPGIVIVIDALSSRRAARITTTIQLTDTGISPGAGVGNRRAGFTSEKLGARVIAVGVPTVVYATTIAKDTIAMIADKTGLHSDKERMMQLADEVIAERIGPMIVTPKDIDGLIGDMASIVATGINRAVHGKQYNEIADLLG